MKIEIEKLKKVNKIKGNKIRIESIKDATKRETEQLSIKKEKRKTVIKELEIEIKFNELGNILDIILLKGTKNSIAEYISNGKTSWN